METVTVNGTEYKVSEIKAKPNNPVEVKGKGQFDVLVNGVCVTTMCAWMDFVDTSLPFPIGFKIDGVVYEGWFPFDIIH